jgi:hypothetical protein
VTFSLFSSHSAIAKADAFIFCILSGNVTAPLKICQELNGLITDPTLTCASYRIRSMVAMSLERIAPVP